MRSGDDLAAVTANRAALALALHLPAPPLWLRQVHGTDVADDVRVTDDEPVADAAVARGPGKVLAILTADCLPVLFTSADGATIGAAHAGWRGLAGGVLEHTVMRMGEPAGSIMAWLGPAIGGPSYEVGAEVRAAFVEHDPGAEEAFTPTRPGHWLCDLYVLARRKLAAIGVTRCRAVASTHSPTRTCTHTAAMEQPAAASRPWCGRARRKQASSRIRTEPSSS